jgi:hypothetical protein
MLTFLSGWVLCSCSLLGESLPQTSECTVRDVLAVRSPVSFVCRAPDWSRVGPARLTVTIRGIDVPETTSPESSAFLESILKRAQKIRLSNIEMGSFFRLTCTVQVDGKDLSQLLVTKGFAKLQESRPTIGPAQSFAASTPLSLRPSPTKPPAAAHSGRSVRITDWTSLLDQTVDLSSITPATSFREALERIRTSIEPALPMMINWNDLRQNAFIEETSPVGVDGFGRVGIGQALELICNAVDGGKGQVSFTQRGKVLIVASKQSLGNPKSLRVIDISELTAPQSTGYGMNGMSGGYGSGSGSGYGSGNGSAGAAGNQLGGMMNNMTTGINRR